jgi:hypothetical protein
MYTREEIETTAQALIQTQLQYQRGILNSRNIPEQFDSIKELIITAFLYEPDSILYLIFLSSRNLRQKIIKKIEYIDIILESIDNLYLSDRPINNTSYISDLKASLLQLDSSASRGGTIGSHSFLRYSQSVDKAINELGVPIRYTHTKRNETENTTEVLIGRQKSITTVLETLPSLEETYTDLYEQAVDIVNAYADFYSSNFTSICNQRQINRALEQISNLDTQINSLTSTERSEIASDSLLSIIANKAIINALMNIREPANPKIEQLISVDSLYRLKPTGTGTPASVTCTEYGPYNLIVGSSRYITVGIDSIYESEIDLLPEAYGCNRASIRSGFPGPFTIRAVQNNPGGIGTKEIPIGSTFPVISTANILHLIVDGVAYEVTLPTSCTAIQLRNTVNAVIGSVVTAYIIASTTNERVIIEYKITPSSSDNLDNRSIQLVKGYKSPADTVLGPFVARINSVNYLLDDPYRIRLSGYNGNNELHIIANEALDYTEIVLTPGVFPDYSVPTITLVSDINAVGGSEFGAESEDDYLVITSTEYGEGSFIKVLSDGLENNINTASLNCLQTLAFSDGQSDTQYNISAQKIVDAINSTTGFSKYVTAKVTINNLREYITITSLSNDINSLVQISEPVSQSAVDNLGFSIDPFYGTIRNILIEKNEGTYWGTLSLEPFKIKIGDTLIRLSDNFIIGTITDISDIKNGILSITPEVLTTFELDNTGGFKIISSNYLTYLEFISDLNIWLSNNPSNIRTITNILNKITNTTPSQQFIDLAYESINELKSNLTDVLDIVDSFIIPTLHEVEESLQLLLEKGYDRARAMLVESKIKEFFELTANTASYSRELMNAISAVTVNDVNEKTDATNNENVYERLRMSITSDTSPLSDYSDMDQPLPTPDILKDQERY